MKILFILLTLSYSMFAKNILSAPKKINNFEMRKDYQQFYIQVGAFTNQEYAIIILSQFEDMNYPVKIAEKQIGLNNYFKLFIGPYKTKDEAYFIKNSLPSGYVDSFIVTYNN